MKEGTERKDKEEAESGWGRLEPGTSVRAVGGTGQPLAGKGGARQSCTPDSGLQRQHRGWCHQPQTVFHRQGFLKQGCSKFQSPDTGVPVSTPLTHPPPDAPPPTATFLHVWGVKGAVYELCTRSGILHPAIRKYFTFYGRISEASKANDLPKVAGKVNRASGNGACVPRKLPQPGLRFSSLLCSGTHEATQEEARGKSSFPCLRLRVVGNTVFPRRWPISF